MLAPSRSRARLAALAAYAWIAGPASLPAAAVEPISAPVAFPVVNQNRTEIDCDADDRGYTVRGHLTGPRVVFEGPGPHAVTLYTYGFDGGEWNWRFQDVEGYDLPAELARDGHISVSIDMVGYDASGHPDGFLSCMGSQADVSHQIVQHLRRGSYEVTDESMPTVKFETVVLAGHDIAGGMAELQAYTWPGDVDGLVLMTWADQGLGPIVFERSAAARQICGAGGEPAEPDDPDSPGGYVFFGPPDEEFGPALLAHAEPAVVEAVLALRNRNPCGYIGSIIPTLTNNQRRNQEIEVPVLLMLGEDDPVFLEQGWALQPFLYGTDDVTSILVENASHFPMLEASAPFVHAEISQWLCDRDLVSAGVARPCALPEPSGGGKATGGGWLETGEGRKLNFGFNAKQKDGAPHGHLKLHDKAAGVKIELTELTALGGVVAACGAIAPGPGALEFRGRGTLDGVDAEFRVCVADHGEPGHSRASAAPDQFHLECRVGCVYDTASRTPDDAIDGGNIQVHADASGPTTEDESGEADVLVLDPVLLSEATAGTPLALIVSAYGAGGEPLPGATIALTVEDTGGAALLGEAIAGPAGEALFLIDAVTGERAYVARSGALESNAVEVTGTAP